MRVLRSGTLVALALALGAGVASAQQHQGHDVCKTDVQKFCKDVQPGGKRWPSAWHSDAAIFPLPARKASRKCANA
jgi:hypothetical protein